MPGDQVDSAALLDAAVEVFGEFGHYGAQPELIAARAGMDPEMVRATFPDTATLLLAALNRRDDGDGEQVEILDRPGGVELLASLVEMVRAGMGNAAAARMHSVISAEAINPAHPAHPWALQRYHWMRALFAGAIRRDQEMGRVRAEVDAGAVAMRVIAMMDGLQLQWLLDGDEVDMAQAFAAYIDELTASIAAPDPE